MKIMFLDMTLCSLVEVNRRFGDAYCLHYQGDRSHETTSGVLNPSIAATS
jgi:hypothetical protein